jgi:hypothetical protein
MKPRSWIRLAASALVVLSTLPKALAQDAKDWKILARASSDDTWIPLALSPVAAKRPSLGRVFRTAEELDKDFLRQSVRDEDKALLLKSLGREKIDWKREMLIAVSGGVSLRGYRLRVDFESIRSRDKVLIVAFKVEKTETVILGFDSGITVAIVPRFEGEVQFIRTSVPLTPR